jgi:hypothetical protein
VLSATVKPPNPHPMSAIVGRRGEDGEAEVDVIVDDVDDDDDVLVVVV